MYKLFLVKKGTKFENEVKKLIEKGRKYIPKFEQEVGLLEYCDDLEVISDGIIDPNIYIVVELTGNYQNDELEEISVEQLKSSFETGYSILGVGTNRLIKDIGYKLNPFNEYLQRIELLSS